MKQRSRRKSGVIDDASSSCGTNNSSSIVEPTCRIIKNVDTEKKIEPKTLKRVLSKKDSPPPKKKSPPLITNKLKQFGNAKAWTDLVSHITGEKKHEPVLLYGPVGCGKSLGVQDCLKLCNINCTLLDGSAPEGPQELDLWISQVRDNSVLEGDGGVLFIDDIESFTEPCKEIILKHVKKTRRNKSPLIITCTNYYAYDLKDFVYQLKNFTTIRLYTPNNDIVYNFLKSKGYSTNIVNSVVATSKGDLRHSNITIHTFYQMKLYFDKMGKDITFASSSLDRTNNIFELSNSLLTNRNEDWFEVFSANGDTSHTSQIRLIHENIGHLLYEPTKVNIRDPLESYWKIVDSFTHTSWNGLPELIHYSGLLCRNLLLCKKVTSKWSFPADKSRIFYSTKKECLRSLRDSYLKREKLSEKKNTLRNIYGSVYEEEKIPQVAQMSTLQIDEAFTKINPIRMISTSIHSWEVPSNLGGLKLV